MSGRAVGLDFLQLRAAIPNLPDVHRSIQVHPVGGARKWVQEAADMGLPCSYVEVEIVCPSRNSRDEACSESDGRVDLPTRSITDGAYQTLKPLRKLGQ
jgi:hypothetical protein